MADVIKNLTRNLKLIFEKSRTNPTRFCELCAENGLSIARSTLSRLMAEEANIGLSTLNDIATGVRLLPGYDWVKEEQLISPDFENASVVVEYNQFSSFVKTLLVELDELEWIELKNETSTIADVAVIIGKSFGIEIVKSQGKSTKAG